MIVVCWFVSSSRTNTYLKVTPLLAVPSSKPVVIISAGEKFFLASNYFIHHRLVATMKTDY